MKIETQQWLRKSQDNFNAAAWDMQYPHGDLFDAVCFHCRLCIEKLIKGIWTERGTPFPKTHDLFELTLLLDLPSESFATHVRDLKGLRPGSVETRYPGFDATRTDAEAAMAGCQRLQSFFFSLL